MSHNLHYVIVKAESCEDAIDRVNDEVLNWQRDENNWFSILYCASENDKEVIDKRDPSELTAFRHMTFSFSNIVGEIKEHISMFRLLWGYTYKTSLEARVHLISRLLSDADASELEENLRLILSFEYSQKSSSKYPSFRAYEFDEYGLTDMTLLDDYEDEEGIQSYIVVVDMHS